MAYGRVMTYLFKATLIAAWWFWRRWRNVGFCDKACERYGKTLWVIARQLITPEMEVDYVCEVITIALSSLERLRRMGYVEWDAIGSPLRPKGYAYAIKARAGLGGVPPLEHIRAALEVVHQKKYAKIEDIEAFALAIHAELSGELPDASAKEGS